MFLIGIKKLKTFFLIKILFFSSYLDILHCYLIYKASVHTKLHKTTMQKIPSVICTQNILFKYVNRKHTHMKT